MARPEREVKKALASNRKARHDYEILETVEAGLQLAGTEVKSMRQGRVQLKDSHVEFKNGQAFLVGVHVSAYSHGNRENQEPERPRRLLLHRREIDRLYGQTKEKGLTVVPLEIYLKGPWIKTELGLARGKKQFDKRETENKRRSTARCTRRCPSGRAAAKAPGARGRCTRLPSGRQPPMLEHAAHRQSLEKVSEYVEELFEDPYHDRENDHFYVRYGTTVLEISVDPYGPEEAMVTVMAYCVQGVRLEEDLLLGLLELNHHLPFGSFSLVGRDVFLSHSLFGTALERSTLLGAIASVANVSDDYDDRICAKYGGQTALDRIRDTGGRKRRAGEREKEPAGSLD